MVKTIFSALEIKTLTLMVVEIKSETTNLEIFLILLAWLIFYLFLKKLFGLAWYCHGIT